jgi:hypothetical protein
LQFFEAAGLENLGRAELLADRFLQRAAKQRMVVGDYEAVGRSWIHFRNSLRRLGSLLCHFNYSYAERTSSGHNVPEIAAGAHYCFRLAVGVQATRAT